MASYKSIQLSLADGSYEYYIHEKEGPDDPKDIGAFLLASSEMERAGSSRQRCAFGSKSNFRSGG